MPNQTQAHQRAACGTASRGLALTSLIDPEPLTRTISLD